LFCLRLKLSQIEMLIWKCFSKHSFTNENKIKATARNRMGRSTKLNVYIELYSENDVMLWFYTFLHLCTTISCQRGKFQHKLGIIIAYQLRSQMNMKPTARSKNWNLNRISMINISFDHSKHRLPISISKSIEV